MAERSIVLRALEALKKACRDLQKNRDTTSAASSSWCSNSTTAADGDPCNSPSMKALLELERKSDRLLFGDPNLSTLSFLLSRLRYLSLQNRKAGTDLLFFLSPLLFFFRRDDIETEISEVAGSIESEIQSWIDRESLGRLTTMLRADNNTEEGEIVNLLLALDSRLSRGFDKKMQSSLLTSRTFEAVESALGSSSASKQVKEACAAVVASMVKFNTDVFVGLILLGGTVELLLDMSTPVSIAAVRSLVAEIKTPLVDEMDAKGEISRVVGLVGDVVVGMPAAEVLMEVGYYGRKETLDSMLENGVVKRLVDLQRRVGGEDVEEGVRVAELEMEGTRRDVRWVARFAVQVEVGEGLRRWREKGWFKLELLRRVKEAAISNAEEATIAAEVLWGASF